MANLATMPSFFPRRLSSYVPAMQYASDVSISGETRVSFGAVETANATKFLSALSVAAGATVQASSLLTDTITEPFGRTAVVVLSGAGTGTITIDGWDYLGQPMSENIALNGATPVNGVKAFKWIRQVTYPTVGAVTMNLGTVVGRLGLPYKAGRAISEESSGSVVSTVGTLVSPVITDPATATTGDPRGLYTPTTVGNSTLVISATFEFYNDTNSSNNGGLHGIAHFAN